MPVNETDNQYLSFVMNGENYAIAISDVREVLTVPKMTRIPRMPDFMRGVINLRGSVVPILDLRMKFGLGSTAITSDTAIIVAEIIEFTEDKTNLRLGLLADSVSKVCAIQPDKIESAPKIGMSVNTSFIEGIGKIDENFTVILNTREILTHDDLSRLSEIADVDEDQDTEK
jgi:purine-binding chemotaxis protein CheW